MRKIYERRIFTILYTQPPQLSTFTVYIQYKYCQRKNRIKLIVYEVPYKKN
jgi:hypothetical protein